ncbi:MAG: hypothetical protein LBV12_04955, partial [Puniceicoccales bacterium]|nr:hypothetical protein [Puniceicoccales bacterium]
MFHLKNWGVTILLTFLATGIIGANTIDPYRDPRLPVERRVADLLSRMTIEEKCEQLQQMDVARLQVFDGVVSPESLERVFKGKTPGVVMLDQGGDITSNTIKSRDLQNFLRKNSRLGIPALFVTGGTQGVIAQGATIFPSPIALGATWNPPLIREMSAKIADEASAMGAAQVLGPSFALGRDPRFGGIELCFGECPTLVTEMGLAYLDGLQGKGVASGLPPNKVFGTALHFTGWGVPSGGLFGAEVSLSSRSL